MKKLIALIALAACTSVEVPSAQPLPDTCNAAEYAGLIGQPATALERVLLLGKVRVIRPSQPVTMDFWPERINFMINEEERIAQITCG